MTPSKAAHIDRGDPGENVSRTGPEVRGWRMTYIRFRAISSDGGELNAIPVLDSQTCGTLVRYFENKLT